MHPKRLTQLEEILEIEYEKLSEFEKALAITSNASARFEIEQQLKREVLPDIRKHETEYAELLSRYANFNKILDIDAIQILAQLKQAVNRFEKVIDNQPRELEQLLVEIKQKLDEPQNKTTAAGRLKTIIPLIPPFVFFESEANVESSMFKIWQQIKSLLRGKL